MTHPIEINPRITSSPIDAGALAYADNPHPRCPVALLLDCSQSMEGEPVAEMNTALRQFLGELREDPVAAMSVEPGVITFGETVSALRPFGPPGGTLHTPEIKAAGRTPMGAALRLALCKSARLPVLPGSRIARYAPWIVLMTDGQPNDDWRGAAADALALSKAGRLVLIGVALGEHADMTTLREIVGGTLGRSVCAGCVSGTSSAGCPTACTRSPTLRWSDGSRCQTRLTMTGSYETWRCASCQVRGTDTRRGIPCQDAAAAWLPPASRALVRRMAGAAHP